MKAIFLSIMLLMSGCASIPDPLYFALLHINYEAQQEYGDIAGIPYSQKIRETLKGQGIESQRVYVTLPDGQSHAMTKVGNYYCDSHNRWCREKWELQGYEFWPPPYNGCTGKLVWYMSINDLKHESYNWLSPKKTSRSFSKRADLIGDGSGADNMNVDGSLVPVEFKSKPPPGERWNVARVIVYVQDSGTFDSGAWGNGIVLANGLALEVKEGGNINPVLSKNVKTTGELASYMHDLNHSAFGSGDEFITARLTFTKFGNPLILEGDKGDEIIVTVNDDLTGLTTQYVLFQGYIA